MKLAEVGYDKDMITTLIKHPLIRENIKNIEKDFELIYAKILVIELPEEASTEDLIKAKSDMFSAFTNGVISSSDVTSQFRKGFVLPDEFNPHKEKSKIIY